MAPGVAVGGQRGQKEAEFRRVGVVGWVVHFVDDADDKGQITVEGVDAAVIRQLAIGRRRGRSTAVPGQQSRFLKARQHGIAAAGVGGQSGKSINRRLRILALAEIEGGGETLAHGRARVDVVSAPELISGDANDQAEHHGKNVFSVPLPKFGVVLVPQFLVDFAENAVFSALGHGMPPKTWLDRPPAHASFSPAAGVSQKRQVKIYPP